MSASTKKKLRNEQQASTMTEKQIAEKKENSRVKLYTILSCVVLALMIVTVIVVSVFNSGIIERNTVALKVGNHSISAVELNYNYIDSINAFLAQYGSYASLMGLDMTKPLDTQVQNQETGATWADYFIEQAKEGVRSTYTMYDAAQNAGYKMTEEDKASLDAVKDGLSASAKKNNFPSKEKYIAAMYGTGASEKSYMDYCEKQILSTSYYNNHQNSLTYDEAALNKAQEGKEKEYSSYSYNSYYLSTSAFLEGGTTDEEGNTTYTDEEKAAAVNAAEEAFKTLVNVKSIDEFNSAIAALDVNKDNQDATSNAYTDVPYSSQEMSATVKEWVSDDSRAEGDVAYLPSVSTAEDGTETTTGFYAVYYVGSNDNNMSLVNVRHILVGFEGGTKDDNGNVTYSDEEKAAAKEKAEAILNEWKSGEATEDSFAALASEKTSDSGSKENGGLYENITPKSMVAPFDQWCFDAARKAGDTDIVETNYGFHVMYFSGNSDITYRNFMIKNDLMKADMETWYGDMMENATLNEVDTSKVRTDLILQPAK